MEWNEIRANTSEVYRQGWKKLKLNIVGMSWNLADKCLQFACAQNEHYMPINMKWPLKYSSSVSPNLWGLMYVWLFCFSGDMTGRFSVYTIYEGHEIMFHVSTLLPYSKDNRQQVNITLCIVCGWNVSCLINNKTLSLMMIKNFSLFLDISQPVTMKLFLPLG
jgi:hypothetical protein